MIININRDDLLMVNCAGCSVELLSRKHEYQMASLDLVERRRYPDLIAGRIAERPYCESCLCGKRKHLTKMASKQ